MNKKFNNWWYVVIAIILMSSLGVYGDVEWEKTDWIFLFLAMGVILLNSKLNKIIKLLSKK